MAAFPFITIRMWECCDVILACLPNEKVRLRSEGAPSFAKIFEPKTRPAFVTVEKAACLRRLRR